MSYFAAAERRAIRMKEDGDSRGPAFQARRFRQTVCEILIDDDPVAGEGDRRSSKIGQREAAAAEAAQSQRQAGRSARHANSQPGIARKVGIGVAGGIEKHAAGRVGWRPLAIVDRDVAVALGEMDEHEPATTEIAGAWQRHRQGQACGDRSIDSVSTTLEDIEANAGGRTLLGDNHTVLRENRERTSAHANNRRIVGGVRRRDDSETHRHDHDTSRPPRHQDLPRPKPYAGDRRRVTASIVKD